MTGTGSVLAWRRPVLAIVTATAFVVLAMVLTGMGPRLPLTLALGGLIGTTIWLTTALGAAATTAQPWAAPRTITPTATRSSIQVSALRARLAHGRHGAGVERVHELLVELLDDQLAAVHGVDRHRDPAAARAILGDELFELAADPAAARALNRRRVVERVVSRIEAI